MTKTPIVLDVPCSLEATHLQDISSEISVFFTISSACPVTRSQLVWKRPLSVSSVPSSLNHLIVGTGSPMTMQNRVVSSPSSELEHWSRLRNSGVVNSYVTSFLNGLSSDMFVSRHCHHVLALRRILLLFSIFNKTRYRNLSSRII